MYYDLHIHSALSPCSDDSMTIHNIINMSLLKGLDLIAITDHNSLLQQDCFLKVAKGKIAILIGVEIQTSDKVHVLGYFPVQTDLKPIQHYLNQHLFTQMNQPEYYGNQLILDENDHVVMVEDRLLIGSLDRTCKEVIDDIHTFGGKAVLGHVYRKYGYIATYGKLDIDLAFDGIEVQAKDYSRLLKTYPEVAQRLVLHNSDAHYLGDIHEPEYQLTQEAYHFLKGDAKCLI